MCRSPPSTRPSSDSNESSRRSRASSRTSCGRRTPRMTPASSTRPARSRPPRGSSGTRPRTTAVVPTSRRPDRGPRRSERRWSATAAVSCPRSALILATAGELAAAVPPERFALFHPVQVATPGFPFVSFGVDTPLRFVQGDLARRRTTGLPARPARLPCSGGRRGIARRVLDEQRTCRWTDLRGGRARRPARARRA